MNNYFSRLTINSICAIGSHHIRKTSTSSFIYKKMKTIIFCKFHNMKHPKLTIKKFRKIIMFLCCISITFFNSSFIQLLHSNIINKVIMTSCYSNMSNRTIFHSKTRSRKTMTSSILFSLTKLSMRNRICFICSILFVSFVIISSFIK